MYVGSVPESHTSCPRTNPGWRNHSKKNTHKKRERAEKENLIRTPLIAHTFSFLRLPSFSGVDLNSTHYTQDLPENGSYWPNRVDRAPVKAIQAGVLCLRESYQHVSGSPRRIWTLSFCPSKAIFLLENGRLGYRGNDHTPWEPCS